MKQDSSENCSKTEMHTHLERVANFTFRYTDDGISLNNMSVYNLYIQAIPPFPSNNMPSVLLYGVNIFCLIRYGFPYLQLFSYGCLLEVDRLSCLRCLL